MAILVLLSFLLPAAIGVLLCLLLLPPRDYALPPAFRLFVGAGMGFGLVSLVSFCFLFLPGRSSLFLRELVLFAVALALARGLWKRGTFRQALQRPATPSRPGPLVSIAFAVTALSTVASFALSAVREPHGKWDAWLIWNLHARFLYRGDESWMDYFRSGLDWTHPDYPLLLPLSIARSWQYGGGETLAAPILTAALFSLLAAGLLYASLDALKGASRGFLGAMALAASPLFVIIGASQLADVPLSFYVLGALALPFLSGRHPGSRGALVTAGLFAGLAAWTKNEGILFAALFLTLRPLVVFIMKGSRAGGEEFAWICAGASLPLAALFAFKTAIAPPNDIVTLQAAGGGALERLGDAGRFVSVLLAYVKTGLTFTQGIPDVRVAFSLNPAIPGVLLLAVYLGLAGTGPDPGDKAAIFSGCAVITILLAGYFLVLVITPHDLNWHLVTSLNRLFLQVWPAAILLVFVTARADDLPKEPAGKEPKGAARRKKEGKVR